VSSIDALERLRRFAHRAVRGRVRDVAKCGLPVEATATVAALTMRPSAMTIAQFK